MLLDPEKKPILNQLKGLLNPSLTLDELKTFIDPIHLYFQKITAISGFEFKVEHLAAVPAFKGKAVGLNHAAQCLLDYRRTHQFVLAIHQAILDQKKISRVS